MTDTPDRVNREAKGSASDLHPDDRYRKRLYEIRSDPARSFAEKLEAILGLGCEYLGVENGHVKRGDRTASIQEVLASVGATDRIHEGDRHEYATSYCRRTIEKESPLAISHAEDEGWGDDPAYRHHGLECYLGATVTVGGETFGTVCFVDRTPQSTAFSPTERAFVELVAATVGNELETLRQESRLNDREYVISVLNRVLRHNLRNGMNATAGFADILAGSLEGEQRALAMRIRRAAEKLVELGETARLLETVVTDPSVPSSRDAVGIVREVTDEFREAYPEADLSVETPDEQRVLATPYLCEAVAELVENAHEHGGESPTVEVRVVPPKDGADDRIGVVVSDDGPGLPPHERRLLRGEEETGLDHGNGLGLCLVYWIVRQAGGEVDVSADDGTTVELRLRPVGDGWQGASWEPYLPTTDLG